MFCSGKVFYDLHAEREKRGLDKKNEVAIVRLEQVSREECRSGWGAHVEAAGLRDGVSCGDAWCVHAHGDPSIDTGKRCVV